MVCWFPVKDPEIFDVGNIEAKKIERELKPDELEIVTEGMSYYQGASFLYNQGKMKNF